ncbi:hypothetical protein MBANPS3_011681 [Mucor bainieri]
MRLLYREFLALKNMQRSDKGQDQLQPWTPSAFNKNTLMEYAIYRSITGKGVVEDKIQLGTIAREATRRENPVLRLSEEDSNFVYSMLVQLSLEGAFGKKGKKQAIFGPAEAKILVETALYQDRMQRNLLFIFQVVVYILVVLYTGVRPSSLSKLDKDPDAGYLQWNHLTIWRQDKDTNGFKLHVKIIVPHLKGRNNYILKRKKPSVEPWSLKILKMSNTIQALMH